ncbi:MAG: sel1 repeat family protein, partial [Elusimicrobia bacterium]|nr:sel1 repeat family protein [Elusimicrobiota bacterium]
MTASLLPAFAALALFGGAAAGTEGSRRGAALEEAFAAYQAGDFSRSAALFRDAAERGDPVAQYNLGVLYQGRQGAPRDDAQAAAWLRKAAEQGDAKAQNELGVMLAAGRGAPRVPESAAAWLRRAAGAGDADAPRNLEALRRAAQPREAGGRRGWWMLGLAGLAAAGLAAWLLAPGAKAAPPPRRSRPPPAGPQAGGALAG